MAGSILEDRRDELAGQPVGPAKVQGLPVTEAVDAAARGEPPAPVLINEDMVDIGACHLLQLDGVKVIAVEQIDALARPDPQAASVILCHSGDVIVG
jgi:hypothetical protein